MASFVKEVANNAKILERTLEESFNIKAKSLI